jgi:adenylate cyclase
MRPELAARLGELRLRLRLGSALILLSFVLTHLSAHTFLLVSEPLASRVLATLMAPWRSGFGTALLFGAFLIHYGNALWSIYLRRSLRLRRWEWTQLALGLCIPLLLALHIATTRVSEAALGTDSTYTYILTLQWVVLPYHAGIHIAALLTVWIHACIGLHFWLRTKRWYPQWRTGLGVFALLFPTLALSGYVSAGADIAQKDEKFVQQALEDANATAETRARTDFYTAVILGSHVALVLLAFGARSVRRRIHESRRPPVLTHPSCTLPVLPGATVLETLRDNGIPHASVCGGRARCTTCRIQVGRGLETLPPPMGLEAKALERIGATAGMRLACQIRPSADIAVTPLLAADASANDGFTPGGLEGSERLVTVMFIDLRGSTTLGEAKLPYDVLFILNRFFSEMNQAIVASNGHYSQFTGDGLMALYGLHADDPARGALDALRGAREMLMRLERLNGELKSELSKPLAIGIGIHHSEAIVGMMGPPRSMIISAIGDTVNTTARLESLTKDYSCNLVLSQRAAEVAGLRLPPDTLHETQVKGRTQTIRFHALQSVPQVPR